MEITLEHVLMLLLFVFLVWFTMCNCGCNRVVEGLPSEFAASEFAASEFAASISGKFEDILKDNANQKQLLFTMLDEVGKFCNLDSEYNCNGLTTDLSDVFNEALIKFLKENQWSSDDSRKWSSDDSKKSFLVELADNLNDYLADNFNNYDKDIAMAKYLNNLLLIKINDQISYLNEHGNLRQLPACRARKGEYQIGYIRDIPDDAYTTPCTSDELRELNNDEEYTGDGSMTRPYKISQIKFQKNINGLNNAITYKVPWDETWKLTKEQDYTCSQYDYGVGDKTCGDGRYCMGTDDGTAYCYCFDVPKKTIGNINTNQINYGFYMIVNNPEYRRMKTPEYYLEQVLPCDKIGSKKGWR